MQSLCSQIFQRNRTSGTKLVCNIELCTSTTYCTNLHQAHIYSSVLLRNDILEKNKQQQQGVKFNGLSGTLMIV